MKTNIPALAFLAAILPVCASAQERAPELPSLSSVIGELGRPAEVRSHEGPITSAKRACMPWMATAQVGRGVFENDYTVKISGQKVATVESTDNGYVIKGNDGGIEAAATITAGGDKKTATVTGCNGEVVGVIEELVGSSSSAFNIKAADGTPLMTTGWVDGGDMAASAPKASMKVEKNGMFDHFTMTINGSAPAVGVITTVMNNAAAYKRSQERNRERMGDRMGRERGPMGERGRR